MIGGSKTKQTLLLRKRVYKNMAADVPTRSEYSASASLVGYLFQCRFALLEMLKRLKNDPQISIAIETLDDVTFEKAGNPTDIIQVKHHINREANITDASIDLWKTIRIWIDFKSKLPEVNAAFLMITTAEASVDSIAYFLTPKNHNPDTAIQKLIQTAQTSSNKETQDIRDSFLALSVDQKKALLINSYIIDRSPHCDDIDGLLQKELWAVCARNKVITFLSYLEGWWFRRVLESILKTERRSILGEEIESQINELRESFKDESLPIHDDLKTITVNEDLYKDRVFVHQLRLIQTGAKRVSIAVNNYYRAFEQRSRWMREELLYVGDLETYEKRLIEEWTTHFETMRDALGATATEEEKIKAAQTIYAWVEQTANISIKQRCSEVFVTRGSYQMLADRMAVGWHPEFESRLAEIIGVKKEASV